MTTLPLEQELHATTTITREDLEAALDLLTDEERSHGSYRRELWTTLLQFLAVGVFAYALPLGLVVVWFDSRLGLALLAAAAAAFALLMVTTVLGASSRTPYRVKESLGSSLSSTADELWDRRAGYGWVGVAFLAGMGAATTGLVLLILGLVRDGDVSALAMVLLAVPIVTWWLPTGVQKYRELTFLSDVAAARSRLESISTVDGEHVRAVVDIPSDDFDVIARAERQRIERDTAKAAAEAQEEDEPPYGLVKTQTVLDELRSLASAAPDAWREVAVAVDSLQTDPAPAPSRPVGPSGVRRLAAADCSVLYSVDEKARRVLVISVDAEGAATDG